MKSPLAAPMAGLLAALLAQASPAQCIPAPASAPGGSALPGVLMAAFAPARSEPGAPATAAAQEADAGQATGLRLVLAGLALMAGIALGRREA